MMAPPPEQPSLTVLSGPLGGTVFVVDESMDNVLVGADPSCRFALPGTAVDPIHARLWIDFEGITVYDPDSRGGVYVNDDRVQGQARLRNGDIRWLRAPGDEKSVMLQCRLPAAEPIERTMAMSAGDVHPAPEPTVSLRRDAEETIAQRPAPPETIAQRPAPPETIAQQPEPEATIAFAPIPSVLAPDAIQPEPTVVLAPGDDEVLAESEPTIAMMPEEL